MDEESEYGVAAHWFYAEKGKPKEGARLDHQHQQLAWVNNLLKLNQEIKDTTQYLESVKIDVFPNNIFVFTPKGDVIDLPEGATPVDFAYHIHTDLGNQCTATRINNQIMPLSTTLKSGDVVEIIVDKKRTKPSPDWLAFVKTRTAREHIKQSLNRSSRLFGMFKRGQ
jgi:GTP pyrophosphokinase